MGKLQVLAYFSITMPRLTSNSVSMSLRMLYLLYVKMRGLHYPTKTEQKLALGGWHSANALALLFEGKIGDYVLLFAVCLSVCLAIGPSTIRIPFNSYTIDARIINLQYAWYPFAYRCLQCIWNLSPSSCFE